MITRVLTRCCACQSQARLVVLRTFSDSPDTTSSSGKMMPFEEYRKLKKSQKIKARVWGVPFAFGGMMTSSIINVMITPNMFEMTPEEIQPILGMDPLMLAALSGAVAAGICFVGGGALYTEVWKLANKKKYQQIVQRDEDFLRRLEKHRFASFGSFHDDYYGDSIQTLSDYRQWARQQQKKKETHKDFVAEEPTT